MSGIDLSLQWKRLLSQDSSRQGGTTQGVSTIANGAASANHAGSAPCMRSGEQSVIVSARPRGLVLRPAVGVPADILRREGVGDRADVGAVWIARDLMPLGVTVHIRYVGPAIVAVR